jgi:hypothetical protein
MIVVDQFEVESQWFAFLSEISVFPIEIIKNKLMQILIGYINLQ